MTVGLSKIQRASLDKLASQTEKEQDTLYRGLWQTMHDAGVADCVADLRPRNPSIKMLNAAHEWLRRQEYHFPTTLIVEFWQDVYDTAPQETKH